MAQVDQDKIKMIRFLRHKTLRELAKETGISTSYLSRLENGLANPSLALLSKIANALNVQVSSLLAKDEANSEADEALYQFLMQPVEELKQEHPQLFDDRTMRLIYRIITSGIYFKEDQHWIMLAALLKQSFTAKAI